MLGHRPFQDNEGKSSKSETLPRSLSASETIPKSYSASLSYKGFEAPSLHPSYPIGSPPLEVGVPPTGTTRSESASFAMDPKRSYSVSTSYAASDFKGDHRKDSRFSTIDESKELDPVTRKEAAKMFLRWDKQGNGDIDFQEFWEGVCRQEAELEEAECQALFTLLDSHSEGFLDEKDFLKLFTHGFQRGSYQKLQKAMLATLQGRILTMEKEIIDNVFKAIDEKSNQDIDVNEFKSGFAKFGFSQFSEKEVCEIFLRLDTSASGYIDCEDFERVFWKSQTNPLLLRLRNIIYVKEVEEPEITEEARSLFGNMVTFVQNEVAAAASEYCHLRDCNMVVRKQVMSWNDQAENAKSTLKEYIAKAYDVQPVWNQIDELCDEVGKLNSCVQSIEDYVSSLEKSFIRLINLKNRCTV